MADGFRQRTTALFTGDLGSGSDTTNQISILYNTDEDGQTIVFPEMEGGYLGIVKVQATNKQRPFPTPEPYLQNKEFQMSYYSEEDRLVVYPVPYPGETGIYFVPPLNLADYSDPVW